MKKIPLFIITFLFLVSCSQINEAKNKINEMKSTATKKVEGTISEIKTDYETTKEQALKAKEEIDSKINDVKEASEKIQNANKAVNDAFDSVSNITSKSGDTKNDTKTENQGKELDVMESIKTE